MKYYLLLIVFCTSCLMASGEPSREQMKRAKKLVKIDGVRVTTTKNKNKIEFAVINIEFSSEDDPLEGIVARVAVELTDKAKNTYLITRTNPFEDPGGFTGDYTGEGYIELSIPYGSFKKLKITAYAIEFGVMDGGEFFAFDADYDDVKTFEELTRRTTTPFPKEYGFSHKYWTYSNL